jgi:hypothetical protein
MSVVDVSPINRLARYICTVAATDPRVRPVERLIGGIKHAENAIRATA